MASNYIAVLHDKVNEGMDFTSPSHLIGDKWIHSHNMRTTPGLEQVPKKIVHLTVGTTGDEIRHISILPGTKPGTGTHLFFTAEEILTSTGVSLVSGFSDDGMFRRWSTALYNGSVYYTNELNQVQYFNGSQNVTLENSPMARYLTTWYDHLVVAYPTENGQTHPNRVQWSDLYNFDTWTPVKGNEADHYDFVEWQSQDYPFTGVTGIGKLRGVLWVYTPTAIIPLQYVGLPKVIQVREEGIVTRVGNTYPWTLVCLDNVHFFYDGFEKMFFAFDGQQPIPIGEPVRQYLLDNLNSDVDLASKMYAYVDTDNREIWWCFVSTASSGDFDKAVVFNYRYRRWFTASVENVMCFCSGTQETGPVSTLVSAVASQTGEVGDLGVSGTNQRLYGTDDGVVLRDAVTADANESLLAQDDPVLESADFHFGDLRTIKETDAMILNAYWTETGEGDINENAYIEVYAKGRNYLSEPVGWSGSELRGSWDLDLEDDKLNYKGSVVGRVLRYKFVGKNIRGLKVAAWSDLVRGKLAEK
jgi:hypothetical protein